MPHNTTERDSLIRGKLSKLFNLGLCVTGIIFIVIGVFKSTLLLYIGCALIGASVGGFIRSRLPMNTMIPSTGVHFVYRSELHRNVQAYHDGLQTYVVMQSQQPCGIGQKKINQYTTITKYFSNMIFLNNESHDRLSIVSALTEKTESNDSCCIICLIHFKNGQEVRQLPCQHMFHINCIDKWLKINRLCPTCRSDITVRKDVKASASTSAIQVHAELTVGNGDNTQIDANADQAEDVTETSLPGQRSDALVSDHIELREADIGDDDDVTHHLSPASNDVVIQVDVSSNSVAVS